MGQVLSMLEEIWLLGTRPAPGPATPQKRKHMEEIAMANAATSGTLTEQGQSPSAARVGANAVPAAARRLDLNAALALGQKRAALAAFGGVMTMTVKEFIVKVVKQNQDPNSAAFLGTQISKQDRGRARKVFAWLKGSAADNQQQFFSYTNCPSEG